MKIFPARYSNTKAEEQEEIQELKARLTDLSIKSTIFPIAIIDIREENEVWLMESNINSSTILNLADLIDYLTELKG